MSNWNKTLLGTWDLTPKGSIILHFSAINGVLFPVSRASYSNELGKEWNFVRKDAVLPLMSHFLENGACCRKEHLSITKLSDLEMEEQEKMIENVCSKTKIKKRNQKIKKGTTSSCCVFI
jgi:hypothetical protein